VDESCFPLYIPSGKHVKNRAKYYARFTRLSYASL
jgi:hypothetical protein